jgi:hypothetical protein
MLCLCSTPASQFHLRIEPALKGVQPSAANFVGYKYKPQILGRKKSGAPPNMAQHVGKQLTTISALCILGHTPA